MRPSLTEEEILEDVERHVGTAFRPLLDREEGKGRSLRGFLRSKSQEVSFLPVRLPARGADEGVSSRPVYRADRKDGPTRGLSALPDRITTVTQNTNGEAILGCYSIKLPIHLVEPSLV